MLLLASLIANAKGEVINQSVWSYRTADDVWSVSINDNYVVAGSDKVYFFNKEGKLLWGYDTGLVWSVSISKDNYVVAGSDKVYFFNKDGLLWSYKTGGWVRSVSIDDGYVVAGSDKVYFFNREGKLLWSYDTGGLVWSVSISKDNYVVAGQDALLEGSRVRG